MADDNTDILRGTLDLLLLKALAWGPQHGYGIARWIQLATDDVLQVGEGSLYPALHRLEEKEWIAATWGQTENNRRAKYYALTARGRERLESQTAFWHRFAKAVFSALDAPAHPAGAP